MKQLLYSLPLLACPVGMGLMMWFMMRGKKAPQARTDAPTAGTDAGVASLRAELDQLRAIQRDQEAPVDPASGSAGTTRSF